jgi:hypothetical protein
MLAAAMVTLVRPHKDCLGTRLLYGVVVGFLLIFTTCKLFRHSRTVETE